MALLQEQKTKRQDVQTGFHRTVKWIEMATGYPQPLHVGAKLEHQPVARAWAAPATPLASSSIDIDPCMSIAMGSMPFYLEG